MVIVKHSPVSESWPPPGMCKVGVYIFNKYNM